jgi:hypothetical protein
MEACEPGQGRNTAAISRYLFVLWVSHPRPRLVIDNWSLGICDGSNGIGESH